MHKITIGTCLVFSDKGVLTEMFSLTPLIFRNAMRRLYIGILLLLAIAPLKAFADTGIIQYKSLPIEIPSYITLAIVGVVLITWSIVSFRRILKKIVAHQYLICGYCGYDLSTMSSDQCPECGARIDVDQLKLYWKYYTGRYLHFDVFQDQTPRPPYLKRMAFRYMLVVMAMCVVYAVLLVYFMNSNPFTFSLTVGFMIFFFGAMKLSENRLAKHLYERLNRKKSMVCLECGSSVTATGEQATCTTCKTEFTTAELIQKWEHWRTLCWPLHTNTRNAM